MIESKTIDNYVKEQYHTNDFEKDGFSPEAAQWAYHIIESFKLRKMQGDYVMDRWGNLIGAAWMPIIMLAGGISYARFFHPEITAVFDQAITSPAGTAVSLVTLLTFASVPIISLLYEGASFYNYKRKVNKKLVELKEG